MVVGSLALGIDPPTTRHRRAISLNLDQSTGVHW